MTSTPNVANRTLFHGDNLDFLRGMNSGTVNLIATDPPFNKSRDFHATPDSLAVGAKFEDRWSWRDDIHDDWLIAIQRDEPEVWQVIATAKAVYGDDMGAFLCWLGVRLLEMHRVLADDGSLYLHIDHTAHAYVKTLLDAIFGRENFRNEIVWAFTGPSNTKRWFPRKHHTILYYVKSEAAPFNYQDIRIPYVKLETGNTRGIFKQAATLDPSGKVPEDYWLEDRDKMTPVGRIPAERTGYPTQKPLALYERIIRASSNPGDVVLDPFCGCATTCVAAEKLGRQWIGMDIWAGAYGQVVKRIYDNRQLLQDVPGEVLLVTTPPERTDGGNEAVLRLETPMMRGRGTRYPSPRTQHGKLLADIGAFCQGCGADYSFDPRVLEVDHRDPKSGGGSDAYENLTLLCPPCNKEKKDRFTLIGLQQENRKNGYMKNEANLQLGRTPRRTAGRRRARR